MSADNRSRTYDLRITNALLYQLSYIGPERPATNVTTGQKVKTNGVMRQWPYESSACFCITHVLITHESYHRRSQSTCRWSALPDPLARARAVFVYSLPLLRPNQTVRRR